MRKFNSTWLYIKKHNVTGLMYFGKTVRDPGTYLGSGVYWVNHLRKHGNNVSTIWKRLFNNEDELSNYAIAFSKEQKIVESNEWANLKIEDGLMGGAYGEVSEETKRKISESNKLTKSQNNLNTGKKRPDQSNFMKNHNPMKDPEISKKLGESRRGINHPGFGKIGTTKGKKLSTHKCKYCDIATTGGNLVRWHNENCKFMEKKNE